MGILKSVQGKLLGSVVLLAFVAAGIGIFGLSKVSESNERIHAIVDGTAARIVVTNETDNALLNYCRYQKNLILASNDAERLNFVNSQREYRDKLNEGLARWDPIATAAGKKHVAEIRELMVTYERLNDQVITLASSGKRPEAQALSVGDARHAFDQVRSILDGAVAHTTKELAVQRQESEDVYSSMRWSIWLVMVLGIGVSLATAWFVSRQTVQRLRTLTEHIKDVAEGEGDLTKFIAVTHQDEIGEIGEWLNKFLAKLQQMVSEIIANTSNIAAASQELAVTATEISRSANSQREETVNVATAMQEMSATVIEVSTNNNHAAEAARQSEITARSGGETVRATVETIRALADDTRESSQRIQELGVSSDQIGKFIGVIDDIADQTNLLALNAAIEAARAGEQGRGFAVVADEVRKLAERTSGATKEITTMVTNIQAETKKAVEAMNHSSSQVEIGVRKALDAGTALDNIIEGAAEAQKIMRQISISTQQQSTATDQVTKNMDQIARMVEQSSTAAAESAKAIENLSEQATQLQSLVGHFKVDDHRSEASGRRTMRPPIDDFSRDSHSLYQ